MPFIEFILSVLTIIKYNDEERYSNTRKSCKILFSNSSMGKVLLEVYLGIQNRRRLRGMRNRRRVYAIDHKISKDWRKSFGEKGDS